MAAEREPAVRRGRAAGRPAPVLGSVRGQRPDAGPLELDPLIHERVRLGIVSALAVNGTMPFTDLRDLLSGAWVHRGECALATGDFAKAVLSFEKVVVEGVNVVKRHQKTSPKNQQGGIFEKALPIHACKVMPVDPKTGKGTRVSFKTDDKGNKIRVAKSGETIPNAAREEAVAAQAEG